MEKLTKFFLSVVFLCFGMAMNSCSSQEEPESLDEQSVVSPIADMNGVVDSFFKSEISKCVGDPKDEWGHFYEDRTFVIRNAEEFASHYKGELPLPSIDFDQYSLIYGVCLKPGGGYLVKTELMAKSSSYQFVVNVLSLPEGYFSTANLSDDFYWGLYPKLKNMDVKVKRVDREATMDEFNQLKGSL